MTWTAIILLLSALIALLWERKDRVRKLKEAHLRELKKVEAEHSRTLAQESARSLALVHNMVEGVLLLDAEGNVLLANAAMRGLFNMRGDPKGRTVMEALRLHQAQQIVERTLVEGRALDVEIEVPRLGGPSSSFQINCARIDDTAGITQGVVLVFNDITRLKQLEDTRREFVANVSHELRTPLSIIKGYAETLITLPPDPDNTLKFAGIIERHADRLTLLVDDLLTISSIESGQMVMECKPLELARSVQSVMDALQRKAEDRGVLLNNNVALNVRVNADGVRLLQVLTNLIDNAIKYGREDGNVEVDAEEDPEGFIVISVSDDGTGIPPESRDRVFERFYRVDKARSRDAGGTGLGLSIVKHLVHAHDGRVWVEESASGGAKFCLTLPKAE